MSETDELQARVAELEAERDALKQKVAHLDKLADLYPISLGNACEDRDKLKQSDRALRKENAALRQEIEMLSGNPEAVHQGALAALSAIKQMTEMKAERDALAERAAQGRKLYEMTLTNELRWMRRHEDIAAENAALRKALMKLRGAVDGIGLDYPYLSECKAEAIEVLSRIPETNNV